MRTFLAIAATFLISGCAPHINMAQTGKCPDGNSILPRNVLDDCRQYVCVNGQIASMEDLTETATVDAFAEEKFCLLHPIDCYSAYSLKKSSQWDQEMTKDHWNRSSLHNGLGDAARHAYLVCEMTRRFSVAFTKGLVAAHEEDSGYRLFSSKGGNGNKCCEKVMDAHNNEVGIKLAFIPGTCEENVLNSLHLLRYSLCREKDEERYAK